ncbi:Hypothetical predicted protein, partial [Paramuricea clavata]
MKGDSFTLRVRNQHHTQTNDHSARVWEEDPTPCMKEFDSTVFQEIEDSGVNPLMFQIEFERSGETSCNSNGLNLQLTFDTEVDQNMNYVILQQEAGSTRWRNITDECTTAQGLRNIDIPVKKSSKVLVFRIKKSLSSLKHALLALIHGQVWFHILVYFLKKGGKIKLRIIGISEELYQNPKGLKTAVTISEENKFLIGEETEPPKQLLKKGNLTLECCKNSECVCLGKFDLGRNDIDKHAEWYKHTFDENDLIDNLEVKVSDKDGNVLWCIDLNEILC